MAVILKSSDSAYILSLGLQNRNRHGSTWGKQYTTFIGKPCRRRKGIHGRIILKEIYKREVMKM
jgi:hypothetical protein